MSYQHLHTSELICFLSFHFYADVIRRLQDILDRQSPPDDEVEVVEEDDSEEEGDLPARENKNYNIAKAEFDSFVRYKRNVFRPTLDRSKSSVLYGDNESGKRWEILVGPVVERGANLPSGRNLADYIDSHSGGRLNVTKFFADHCKTFPTIWILVQSEAAMRNVEVGCERFFSLTGYISAPRRTRIGVRTYERIAMLASMLPKVYIDMEWVSKEYLRRCKAGAWKKENTEEALKCWNLERVLDAELQRMPTPPPLTLEQLVAEEATTQPSSSNETEDEVDEVADWADHV